MSLGINPWRLNDDNDEDDDDDYDVMIWSNFIKLKDDIDCHFGHFPLQIYDVKHNGAYQNQRFRKFLNMFKNWFNQV